MSSVNLSPDHLSILNKGLNFVPSLPIDILQLHLDLDRFFRNIRLRTHIEVDKPEWACKAAVSSTSIFTERIKHLKPHSKFNPPKNHVEVETFVNKVRQDVGKLVPEDPKILKPPIALKDLLENKDLIFKKADKGASIVIQDKEIYRREILTQLNDTATYRLLPQNPLGEILKKLGHILDYGLNQGIISENTYNFLFPCNPVTPVLYTLPKVHKSLTDPPGRPIVSGTDSVFQASSIFLDCLLRPLAQSGRSFLKDTNHFLNHLDSFDGSLEDCLLVTLDVKSLYTSIPHTLGLEAVRQAILVSEYTSEQQDFIMMLLDFVLSNNYFLFEDRYYLQTAGTAMGANVAPSFAIIFMNFLEESSIYPSPLFTAAKLYLRFIDDIFMVWKGSEESLSLFMSYLNSISPTISFTSEYSSASINFLDVKIQLMESKFSTDLFLKPTDRNAYLHYSSNHPRHTLQAIPYSQFLRVKRIVSDPSILDIRLKEMTNKFLKRGYPRPLLNRHLARVASQSRSSLLRPDASTRSSRRSTSRLPFVSDFSQLSPSIRDIIYRHWHILSHSYPAVFSDRPLMSFRRGKTLSNYLVKSDLGPLATSVQQTITGSANPGTFPCLSCAQCGNVTKGPYFTHPSTGKRFRIKGHFSCRSSYIIYLIKCPCGLGYIGKTTQMAKDRISKHKSTIRTCKVELPIPEHFLSHKHQIHQLRYQIIDWVPVPRRGGDRDALLSKKELYWILKLDTLHPRGLNREFESF